MTSIVACAVSRRRPEAVHCPRDDSHVGAHFSLCLPGFPPSGYCIHAHCSIQQCKQGLLRLSSCCSTFQSLSGLLNTEQTSCRQSTSTGSVPFTTHRVHSSAVPSTRGSGFPVRTVRERLALRRSLHVSIVCAARLRASGICDEGTEICVLILPVILTVPTVPFAGHRCAERQCAALGSRIAGSVGGSAERKG